MGICEIKDVEIDYNDYDHLLILDGVNDPGNLGTLIRTALGFNIDLIVLSKDTVDLYNSKSIRATQGAMFALPIIYRDLENELDLIKRSNIKIIGTSLNTNNKLDSLEKIDRYAIVLGNEARGAKESTLEKTDINVIIETNKKLESLNVSIAGAIMMYELNKK
jgi:TrmH family RNA methyltransferase